jgi:hypothetical protein
MDSSIITVAIAMGGLIALGMTFLIIGDRWAKRAPTGHGDFFPTLHVLAIVAALIGGGVVWMSFATDHPRKWLHLTIPLVFVAIVYGYALGASRDAWMYLLKDIRARLGGKNAL